MPFSVVERNASINGAAGRMTYVTLYNGNPEGGGTELAGISRVAVPGWTAASNGSRSLSGSVGITVPAGSTFDHVAFMDGPAAGTVRGYMSMAASTFGSEGTYTIKSGSISFPAA
jgi:hypothetical protein